MNDASSRSSSLSVLVIGAGLAHGLRAAGLDVHVFDGDAGPDARPQGFRISIDGTGAAALRALLPAGHHDRLAAITVRDVGRGFTMASGAMRPLVRFSGD